MGWALATLGSATLTGAGRQELTAIRIDRVQMLDQHMRITCRGWRRASNAYICSAQIIQLRWAATSDDLTAGGRAAGGQTTALDVPQRTHKSSTCLAGTGAARAPARPLRSPRSQLCRECDLNVHSFHRCRALIIWSEALAAGAESTEDGKLLRACCS